MSYFRIRSVRTGMLVHEVRGVCFIAWVRADDYGHAAVFPDTNREEWLRVVGEIAGEPVEACSLTPETKPVADESWLRKQLEHIVDMTHCPNPNDPTRRYIRPSQGLAFSNAVNAIKRALR